MWGLAAAIPAVAAEFLYRKVGPSNWLPYVWLWVPLQVSIGYFIYRLVTSPGTSLLDSFVIWSISTTGFRILVAVVLLGDVVKGGTWFAMGLLVMARVAQAFWGR